MVRGDGVGAAELLAERADAGVPGGTGLGDPGPLVGGQRGGEDREEVLAPGLHELFQYVDEHGAPAPVTSIDVNAYLHEVSGGPFTAKDFRTWAATITAAALLCAVEHPGSVRGCKQCVTTMLASVAARLGHTPAVCRGSYIHPVVIADFNDGKLAEALAAKVKRALRGARTTSDALDASALSIEAMRALEPVVARYLAASPRRA